MTDLQSHEATQVLEVCQRIEDTLEELYGWLAIAHADYPEIAALWQRLAGEEHEHARQIGLVVRMQRSLTGTVKIDRQRAEQALALLRQALAKLREHPPRVVRSLELALSLEERFIKVHAAYAVDVDDPSQRRLLESLSKADAAHVAAIRAVHARWQRSGS
jgi:rubrerythrin